MLACFRRIGVIRVLTLLAIGGITGWGNPQVHSTAPLVSGFAVIQQSREWDRYTIRGGEFSVRLPTAPAMSTYELSLYSRDKVRIRHLIGAYSNGVVYAIYVFAPHSPTLKGYTRDLQIGKGDGKEFVSQTSDYKRIDQYFVSKSQIYLFMAYGYFIGE